MYWSIIHSVVIGVVIALVLRVYPPTPTPSLLSSPSSICVRVLSQTDAHPLNNDERQSLSQHYLSVAQQYSGRRGEGDLGWLHLLASYSFDSTNEFVLSQLVRNYVNANYSDLAMDELQSVVRSHSAHSVAVYAQRTLRSLQSSHASEWKRFYGVREDKSLPLPPIQLMLPFSTAVAQWNLIDGSPSLRQLNKDFYAKTVDVYERFVNSVAHEKLSDTVLNHRFFNHQMEILESTGRYYCHELPLFHALMATMQKAAANLLMQHGHDERSATAKARHRTIFWTSVHTGNSVHNAHNTKDSLIGGVYYVTVPKHSGPLLLYDPRGKNPIHSQTNRERKLPMPPFHKMVQIDPYEGLLVLFPGWLVHQVMPSRGLNVAKHGYRISISINLKGEWQDTSGLHYVMNN